MLQYCEYPNLEHLKEKFALKLLPKEHAQLVTTAIATAQTAGDLPTFEIPTVLVTPPKKAEQGDYATAVAMQLAKPAGMKPIDIATVIVKHLPPADYLAGAEVAPPGFINFRLNDVWLKQQVETIIAEGDSLFTLELGAGKRAQVEFVSANPSGPITVGRSRGGIIGDTMARLLEAAGYSVQREYYFNNAGNQMINLGNSLRIRYLEALGKPVQIPGRDDLTFYQGSYLVDFAAELVAEQGEALLDADWQPFKAFAEKKMFEWIKETLAKVQIVHDNFFNEHTLYESRAIWDVLENLSERGYVYQASEWEGATEEEKAMAAGKAPAQWFRSTKLGDDKDRVLVRGDGTPTYTLPDIAYHLNKLDRGFDLLVNVLGADHGTEYKVVQYGVDALGYDPSKIHVIINQMVRAVRRNPETGALEELKMSTRRGVYDTLDDLVEMTSADAIRYHMLARSPGSHLDFNVEDVVKQTNDNPVYYIQNAYVRCRGIAREAEARGITDDGADITLLGAAELRFVRKALELGDVIEQAVITYEPHKIAFYAQDLAGTFHPIYDEVRALHGDVPEMLAKARLRYYRAASVVFKRVLALMGMSAPERM